MTGTPITLMGSWSIFLVAFLAATLALILGQRYLNRKQGAKETAAPAEPDAEPVLDWLAPIDGSLLLKEDSLSSFSFWDRFLTKINGVEMMQSHIAEAGLKWSVGRLTLAMLLAGAATFAILHQMSWIPGLVSVAAALAAAAAPYFMVLRRRQKNLLRFEEQFPDALDTLARALRAGNTLAGGLELLSRETQPPLSSEMRKALDERNLGLSWDQALANLAIRIPIQEVSMFTAAIQLQGRTGGRLHEVLAKLAENMRESTALRGEIRAIAAHGKMTGLILTALPVVIVIMMAYVNPSYLVVLWTHPSGKSMIFAAIGCLVLAHFVIRKLVDIKI
ncbi:MAG: type II secretion system F family protein [Acidobacteriia bacterium]|nr:type II secretion system F family protein [Terriglobia bacterium]